MPRTVLNQTVGISNFPNSLVRYINDAAQRARETTPNNPYVRQRVRGLLDLAEFIDKRVDNDDPRKVALWKLRNNTGGMEVFEPGHVQGRVLGSLGMDDGPLPQPVDVFHDLILGGVEDMIHRNASAQNSQREELDRLRPELDDAIGRAEQATAARDDMQAELDAALAEVERLTVERNTLREMLPGSDIGTTPGAPSSGDESTTSAPGDSDAKPRRTPVEGHPGVYLAPRKRGDVYEITWTEPQPDGGTKQRWQKVGTDLTEAVRAREELLAKAAEPAAA